MMIIFSADRALDALNQVQRGRIEPIDGLSIIANVILENLDHLQVVNNSQNAGQIANILAAELFPRDPLSGFVLRGLESGLLPNLSANAPDKHSIYRGCAIFAASIRDSYSDDAPKDGGKAVYDLIEKLGYLPSNVREY